MVYPYYFQERSRRHWQNVQDAHWVFDRIKMRWAVFLISKFSFRLCAFESAFAPLNLCVFALKPVCIVMAKAPRKMKTISPAAGPLYHD